MIFMESLISDLISILIGLLVSIIAFYKWSFSYWKRKGVPVPYQPSIPFGHLGSLFLGRSSFGESFEKIYNKLKADKQRFGGVYMFTNPIFIPVEPELVKNILVNDFQYFVNHGTLANENDPLSVHLFNMEDEAWKEWRMKLTPTFTTGKMKMMLDTVVETTRGLKNLIDENVKSKRPLEIKETMARFITDVIGSCVFGIECNSLTDPESSFRRYGRRAIEDVTMYEQFKNFLQFVLPRNIYTFLKIRSTDREVEQFFINAVQKTVEYREQNNIFRKDFMHLLLQLKNRGKVTDDEKVKDNGVSQSHLSMDQLAAQCFLFFLAGYETSTTVSTFALYELAKNQEIQDKLREEIKKVLQKYDGKITYEGLMEMNYLEKVIHESLRKYPPAPSLFRICSKDYAVPDSSIVLEKGTQIQISVLGMHRDPEYYPDPEKFDPERFNDENKKQRHPFTWLPFGEGPRICIGLSSENVVVLRQQLAEYYRDGNSKDDNKKFKNLVYKVKIFLGVEDDLTDASKHLLSKFIFECKQKWSSAKRNNLYFNKKESTWLNKGISFVVKKNVPKRVEGRPSKNFSESSDRSKRRKTENLRMERSSSELLFAAKMNLKRHGRLPLVDNYTYLTHQMKL